MENMKARLSPDEPPAGELRKASVAVIIRNAEEPDVLLIKRAESVGDPWSGQIAFPGGKYQEGDGSLRRTAVREALEEVGIDLADAELLGYYGPFGTHTGTLDVYPVVFLVKSGADITLNGEVASCKWVPLRRLSDEGARTRFRAVRDGEPRDVPALRVDDYVVWGLTQRMLSTLLG